MIMNINDNFHIYQELRDYMAPIQFFLSFVKYFYYKKKTSILSIKCIFPVLFCFTVMHDFRRTFEQ